MITNRPRPALASLYLFSRYARDQDHEGLQMAGVFSLSPDTGEVIVRVLNEALCYRLEAIAAAELPSGADVVTAADGAAFLVALREHLADAPTWHVVTSDRPLRPETAPIERFDYPQVPLDRRELISVR